MSDPAAGPPDRPPRLRRSRDNRVVAGVAGGLGEFLGIEPAVVRLAFVMLTVFGGSGLLFYLLAWLVLPSAAPGESIQPVAARSRGDDRMIFGSILVILGAVWLVNSLLPGYDHLFWPALLIAVGAGVIGYALAR